MKYFLRTALTSGILFFSFTVRGFAAEAAEKKTFFEKLGDNIWYILLVIAFGAGLIIITKWSSKIKARDKKTQEEYELWKKEHPEEAEAFEDAQKPGSPFYGAENGTAPEEAPQNGGDPDGSAGEDETPQEQENGNTEE
ncbi:MAG: hypothetical protein IJU52_09360 [Clostridia bacterium]|nr:hypothetical protein [Clostridia bacterium]